VTSPPASRGALRNAPWVGAAALVSGIGSYVLLIIVAANTTAAEYSGFAVFWSLAVTIGLGAYFPIEQETARVVAAHRARPGSGLARTVFGFAAAVTLLAAALSLLLLTPAGMEYIGSATIVGMLVVVVCASAIQFPVRGFLSGGGHQIRYSLIVGTEGLLRILLPVVVVVLGMTEILDFAIAIALATVLSVVPAFVGGGHWMRRPAMPFGRFSSHVLRLILAALSIQLLLNSPVLIARAMPEADAGAFAGQVLASLSIARIPVFVYGVVQVIYLPLVSAAWARSDLAATARIVRTALGVAAIAGVLTVAVMGLAGEWVVSLVFGPDLALDSGMQASIGLGVGIFIVAMVASDAVLGMRGHTIVARSWVLGVVVAAVTGLLLQDAKLVAVVPLMAGALTALVQLLAAILIRLRRGHRSGSVRLTEVPDIDTTRKD